MTLNLNKCHLVTIALLIISTMCISVQAQITSGISINFTQGDTEIQQSEFATNVLSVYNHSNTEQKISLSINAPAGWKIFGSETKEIIAPPKDSLYIPVRLKPFGDMKGDQNYVCNTFVNVNGFTVTNAVWNISVKKKSLWNVSLSSNRIYFAESSDSATYQVNISNNGNADESLIIETLTEEGIYIKSKENIKQQSDLQIIQLKTHQDTILTFSVLRENKNRLPTENYSEDVIRHRLKIKVRNERQRYARGTWSGAVNFIKLPSERKVEESIFQSFPLTLEWNSYNILEQNTYGSLGLYGTKSLDETRSMTYYYQANFVHNEMNWSSLLGNYFYLGYFSEPYNIEVGDITTGRSGSSLVGSGIKASYKYKNHRLGGVYIGSPTLFQEQYLKGYGGFYHYKKDKIRGELYYESTNNEILQKKSNYATADISYRINPQHQVQLGGGYSKEDYTGYGIEGVTGVRAIAGYQGNIKKYTVNSHLQYHSESYAARRGVINGMATVGYPLTSKIRLRGGSSFFRNEPSFVLSDGTINDSIYNGRTQFYVQMLNSSNGNNYVIQPEYSMYTSNYLDANTAGMRFEYRTRLNDNSSFFSTAFAGQNSFPTHDEVDPIFVSNIRVSLRYKKLNTNIRYYYGPFYLNEQIAYVQTQQNPQRLFAMINHDLWFAKNRMRLNLNLNYNYTTIQGRSQFVSRPEIYYYTKSRFEFNLYANYLMYGNAAYERSAITYSGSPIRNVSEVVPASSSNRVEFGFGFKFNINVPAGLDRNYRVTMVVFRDLNGNGVKDKNEPGYENMLIKVTPTTTNFTEDFSGGMNDIYELITDMSGQVTYNHLPKGNYKIESIALAASEGWFSGKEFYEYIDGNKIIQIPLSRGARLSGGIFVERDIHTDNKAIQLAGIRVTAVNQLSGETESNLTDTYGNYSMYLPNGDYIVSINEGAVGSRYQFVENNIPISVKNSGENYNVGFYLVEQKRKINFGSKRNGNAILRSSRVKDNRDDSKQEELKLIPINSIEALGKGRAIQLFATEKERLQKTEIDTLNSITSIYCIQNNNQQYLYLTGGISGKKAAKKLLGKIKLSGFNEATIIEIKSLNIESKETENSDESPQQEDSPPAVSTKQLINIESDADKAFYRIQIESSAILYEPGDFDDLIPDIETIYLYTDDVMKYYSVGEFKTEKEAKKYLKSFAKKHKTNEAIIKTYAEQ